jgi:hypothetical protein
LKAIAYFKYFLIQLWNFNNFIPLNFMSTNYLRLYTVVLSFNWLKGLILLIEVKLDKCNYSVNLCNDPYHLLVLLVLLNFNYFILQKTQNKLAYKYTIIFTSMNLKLIHRSHQTSPSKLMKHQNCCFYDSSFYLKFPFHLY